MDRKLAHVIAQDAKFIHLVKKRSRYSLLLSVVVLAVYFAFILTIAFYPQLLAVKLASGSVISVGIPVGIAIILLSFVLTGIYVKEANSHYDEITKELIEQEHILEHLKK